MRKRLHSARRLGLKSSGVSVLFLLLVSCVLVLPGQPDAYAQTEQNTVSESLPATYYNATAVQVSSVSVLAYAAKSNVSVGTAVMSPAQFSAYKQQFNFKNSLYSETGTESYNALLATPGTYYIVERTGGSPASVVLTYVLNSNIKLANSTTSVAGFVTVPAHKYLHVGLHRETLGAPFKLVIFGGSNATIQYSVYDNSTNSFVFQSPFVTVANLTAFPKVSGGYNLSLGPGLYTFVLNNTHPFPVYAYAEYTIFPQYVNPFLFNNGAPAPTGIAAYGITNSSGTITPYTIESNSVVGFAMISSISAQDLNSGGPFPIWPGSITDQATLQQNNILLVRNRDDSVYTYWPQNVIGFSTSNNTLAYEDNVLNITGDLAQLGNQTIQGQNGFVSGYNSSGVEQTYYGNYLANYSFSYTLPLTLLMYMNESVVSGQGVLIQMGVRQLAGGSNSSTTWYDHIMIDDPAIASASFVVKGDAYTQAGIASIIGLFYDAELIFGGGAGGQAATFSSLSAELALYYQNGTLKPFPSLYTFGVDTGEAAYNVQVVNGSGYASLQSGTPDYTLLTNNFNSSLTNLEHQAQQNSSSGVSTSTLIDAVVIAAVVVLVLVFAMLRRVRAPSQPERRGVREGWSLLRPHGPAPPGRRRPATSHSMHKNPGLTR